MQCYTELVPPSGVTHSISLPFTTSDAGNLVVGRTNLLQVFSHKQVNQGQDTKLVLEAEFSLSGTITALNKVKLQQSKSGGYALLVAFRDAKLSLVEWDHSHHSISTISIHFYENHDLLQCPWNPDLRDCVNHLSVDPSSRCAAFNFGVGNLAVIPFHQSNDDLAMDDFEDDVENGNATMDAAQANGTHAHDKPYFPSFVLPLTAIDPGLLHPMDMAFLHEYREPTIGILFSTAAPSSNLATERKDSMIYAVYTLDIEQRASISLLSITKLPNDLSRVVALPGPVGGSLLLGGNELVHIDQGGKANAIGVNEFAKECSAFPMADRAEYAMRLEGCQIEDAIDRGGEMLLTLANGELTVLKFRLDGRSVSGLSLASIATDETPNPIATRASCMTNIGQGRIFIGSEDSDSFLVGPSKSASHLKRYSSRVYENGNGVGVPDESRDDDDEDDDLYTTTNTDGGDTGLSGSTLRVLDRLQSIGPIMDTTFGRRVRQLAIEDDGQAAEEREPKLELAVACNKGRAGGIALINSDIEPRTAMRIKDANSFGVWSSKSGPEAINTHDDIIILSSYDHEGKGRSSLLNLFQGELTPREETEFDENTTTIAVGRLSKTNHTVQVSSNDIRVYDSDFALSQIFPIADEDSGVTVQVVAAFMVEPYVALLKDDSTFSLLQVDTNGELDEVELPSNVPSSDVISISLYNDTGDYFKTSRYLRNETNSYDAIILSVATASGEFNIFNIADLKIQVFQYHGINFLPPLLSPETPVPKHWRNPDKLAEVLLADLGDEVDQRPYLAIRNTMDDVVLYQAFAQVGVEGAFRFRKVATRNAEVTDNSEEAEFFGQQKQRLYPLPNVNGRAIIVITGTDAAMILKGATGSPKVHKFGHRSVRHISAVNDTTCPSGFVYVDSDSFINFAQLPSDTLYDLSNFSIRKFPLQEEVTKISYYDRTQSYLLATQVPVPFQLPQDDEWHPEWSEERTKFLPTTTQSTLRLFSAKSFSVLSSHEFESNERVLALKCMSLEVSEETHERKDLIVVGTAVFKAENVVTRGNIYIFDIVDVNPDPDVPEIEEALKLKVITKEDVRGSVSAITSIGSQGFLLASQGQKAMVRGLKEDKTLLPVAFMDMRFHVSVARELAGTGMTILGDAFSGLWLMGYSEEPYKMQLLGRDRENPECIAAEFMPDNRQLLIISSDRNGDLRVLQYDPENPKSERGTQLLARSNFNTGSYQTSMTLLPRTPTSFERATVAKDAEEEMEIDGPQLTASYKHHQIILTSQTGAISLLTPLSEQTYRRLSTLQNILTTQLEQPCGLNPRAFRAVETDGVGGRGIIDGEITKRFLGLSSWHRGNMADKVGGSVWEVRGDLEGVGGAGLGFL